MSTSPRTSQTPLSKIIAFCLYNKLIVFIGLLAVIMWGILVAPFDWEVDGLPRNPVPVDAIPDTGENQQIVFTKWPGRSPQDIEDQITYPLTVSLLGVPGVKTVRSYSMMGFSSIYIIFDDDAEFYWSRSRVLEKLNSLPSETLPSGVQPALGPDATAVGQVYWYTLEGRDKDGNVTGGWDLAELRTAQDWNVRYALMAAEGISEVASIGGFQKEYQIDVDPDAMRAFGVSIEDVMNSVKMANIDVGAKTIEINKSEYLIRGLGFIKSLEDIENSVIKVNANVPVYIKNVAKVSYGPALRRGALDNEGTEAVGGVAVVRYGANPMEAINNLKKKIHEISPGLPKKTLPDGTISQLTIIPFYDRTKIINETLNTLNDALIHEVLITALVILILVMHFKSSVVISGILPIGVLMCFCAMKTLKVDANIVALSGIAIAIGTMVDMGIVICENIYRHLNASDDNESRIVVILRASTEVGGAILTAVSTTIISFLPVFTMEAAEGKLFAPLAWTKTIALVAASVIALFVIPSFALILFKTKSSKSLFSQFWHGLTIALGIIIFFFALTERGSDLVQFIPLKFVSLITIASGIFRLIENRLSERIIARTSKIILILFALGVSIVLSRSWIPLGIQAGDMANLIFVCIIVAILLSGILLLQRFYRILLNWCLENKIKFLFIPCLIVIFGGLSWLGIKPIMRLLPPSLQESPTVAFIESKFPGLGKEFMPSLDEGAYLYMPTTMPHASIGESMDTMRKQDMAIRTIHEVESVVGKLGRVESALDPAPVSMVETIINYKPEYLSNKNGKLLTFKWSSQSDDYFKSENGNKVNALDGKPYLVNGTFLRDPDGSLIPDKRGKPFRLWRPRLDKSLNPGRREWKGIQSQDDIWDEIVFAAEVPGSTSAPKLQPIAARLVMLQSGMRAPMGIKIKGTDLETIEKAGLKLQKHLKKVPSIAPETVIADRIVGKPYLEIDIDRKAIARFGMKLSKIQEVIETGIGGKNLTTTVEGRERYPIRVRYLRELRDDLESLGRILIPAPDGAQIPLEQLADIRYMKGPQSIKSEDTFLIGYVLFDKKQGFSEVDVVEEAQNHINSLISTGEFSLPTGVSYTFAGNYENQKRSEERLKIIIPISLILIFIILYLQFKSAVDTLIVFSGIFVAWAGGFVMLWLYGQNWFLDFSLFGIDFRELLQVRNYNLSVAVWVGFLALFGIASDDGVIMATYLNQKFKNKDPRKIADIRESTILAGMKRVRPCLMTTATTTLALIPILTSSGRGADVMIPMAIPTFGGMVVAAVSMFVVPVLYCTVREYKSRSTFSDNFIAITSIMSFFVIPIIYLALQELKQHPHSTLTEPSEKI